MKKKLSRQEYANCAHDYDRRWEKYVERSVQRTLETVAPTGGDYILDLGCGTGTLLKDIHEKFPGTRLTGIDVTSEMLERAIKKTWGCSHFIAARSENIPIPASSIDWVFSVSSFHIWDYPARALGEIYRVLRPGGRIILTDWCADFLSMRIMDRFLRLSGRARYLHVYTLTEWEDLFGDSKRWRNIHIRCYKITPVWGLMTLRAEKSES